MSSVTINTGNKNDDKILGTLIDLIGSHPIEEIGMRQVAEKAGVTPPTLYNRFGSKDRLISAALEQYYRNAIIQTLNKSQHRQRQIYQQIFEVAELYARACRHNGGYVNALMTMHFKIGGASPVMRLYEENCDTFRSILTAMKDAKELRDDGDVDFLAQGLTDICYSMAHAWCQNRIKPKQLASHFRSRLALFLQSFVSQEVQQALQKDVAKLSAI